MIDKIYFIELCEKFVNNSLTEDEKKYLNNVLTLYPELKKEFDDNIEFFNSLNNLYAFKIIKQTIEKEHVKKQNLDRKVKNIISFSIKYSAVAAVVIVAVLFTLHISGWFEFKQQMNQYTKLSKQVTIIANNQKSLWKKIMPEAGEISVTRGTAFLLSKEKGYLITNRHIVNNQDSVLVISSVDSISFFAKVIYKDEVHDLAILKANDTIFRKFSSLPYSLNFKPTINLASSVFSLGYSKNSIVYSEGIISSVTGYNDDTTTIQVSFSSNPGYSGSPVINSKGEVIGIVCGKIFNNEGSTFIIKSSYIKNIIDSLKIDILKEVGKKSKINNLSKEHRVNKIIPFVFKVEALY
ncbi:MAG: S1C family serine protease [Bacteroidales bacterium]|nr:S1C family serine protease [Bacteroidales bacterium]